MKKLIIIIIGLLVIGGLGFGGYTIGNILSSEDSEFSVGNVFEKVKENVTTSKEEEFLGSIQDLMTGGKSQKCTYQQFDDDGELTAEGVIYVADNNVRTEINITDAEEDDIARMDMIITGDWAYVWTNVQTQGMKAELAAMDGGEAFNASEDISDLEKELDMKCSLWIKDKSKFEVPTDIEFEDITELMEQFKDIDVEAMTKEAEADAKEFLCEHCKNAPTPELMEECLGDVVCD